MAQGEPSSKKSPKRSIISDHIHDSKFQETFFNYWHSYTAIKTDNLEVIPEPFRVCRISNFLSSREFIDEMKKELRHVENHRISSDYFQLEQTFDLADEESKGLKELCETFQTDLVAWMKRNTNIELKNKISISSTCYSNTDFLLCHDDNSIDRRIAFILYLSENWEAAYGGSLDLFETDERGLPRNDVHSLVPEYNSFVFFEVTKNSFHQVAEVTASESRLSINGWFHGPVIEKKRPLRPGLEIGPFLEPENTQFDLSKWISERYLVCANIKDIQGNIEKETYTYLNEFLQPEIFQELSEELASEEILWEKVGPADLRNYEIAQEDTLPEKLKEFCKLLKSIAIFDLLKQYTELDLVPDGKNMKPTMRMELQRWSAGCYTLLSDFHYIEYTSDTTDEKSVMNVDTMEGNRLSEGAGSGSEDNLLGEALKTPPSSGDETDAEILKRKSPKSENEVLNLYEATSSYVKESSSNEIKCGSDSKEADIEGSMSDPISDESLDVIIQFHTDKVPDTVTIDYMHPKKEGALIHVPAKDNHLCLAYKTNAVCRFHKYLNHNCKGYFYNMICTYYE